MNVTTKTSGSTMATPTSKRQPVVCKSLHAVIAIRTDWAREGLIGSGRGSASSMGQASRGRFLASIQRDVVMLAT